MIGLINRIEIQACITYAVFSASTTLPNVKAIKTHGRTETNIPGHGGYELHAWINVSFWHIYNQ